VAQNETPLPVHSSSFATHCEDHRRALIDLARLGRNLEAVFHSRGGNDVLVDDWDLVLFGLLPESHHQVEPVDLRDAGIVLDAATGSGLSAEYGAEYNRFDLVPGGVEGGGIRRSALSDDDYVVADVFACHCVTS
jgi:hypothetical protein